MSRFHQLVQHSRQRILMGQVSVPYPNAYPKPTSVRIVRDRDADMCLDVPIHLSNDIILAAQEYYANAALNGGQIGAVQPFAVLAVEGQRSAITTVESVSLQTIPMNHELYTIFQTHLATGQPATQFKVKHPVLVASRYPGPSDFRPRLGACCQDFNFFTEVFNPDGSVREDEIIINGYADEEKPGQRRRFKAKDARARGKLYSGQIKLVIIDRRWVAEPGSRRPDIIYQLDAVNNPAIRPNVDYHAVFRICIACSATMQNDFPSGIPVRRDIIQCVNAIANWAKGYSTWRVAQRSNSPPEEIMCPVDPPTLEEVELLRVLGSGKEENSANRGVITLKALGSLKGAHLDFLLIHPVVVDPFWKGAGIYDYLEQAPDPGPMPDMGPLAPDDPGNGSVYYSNNFGDPSANNSMDPALVSDMGPLALGDPDYGSVYYSNNFGDPSANNSMDPALKSDMEPLALGDPDYGSVYHSDNFGDPSANNSMDPALVSDMGPFAPGDPHGGFVSAPDISGEPQNRFVRPADIFNGP